MSAQPKKRLRLLKVIVQPVLILDDGETLSEQTAEPVQVAAADWPGYPDQLAQQVAQTEIDLNEAATPDAR